MLENQSLVLDLLEWLAKHPRTYDEVMAAWRTSCPRLPVWEDACDHGLVVREHIHGAGTVVRLTTSGEKLLTSERGVSVDLTSSRSRLTN